MPFGCGEEEGQFSDNLIDEPWVICPNCEEPIYMSDCEEPDKDYFDCPACCFVEEDLI